MKAARSVRADYEAYTPSDPACAEPLRHAKIADMGRQVTLFSGYSQGENRTTNYCLLMLRMLYEENPKFLGQVLATLAGEDAGEQVGVQFRQQERKGTSVPDGLIFQPAFTLYIETKNFDWFKKDQLEEHLKNLNLEQAGTKVLLALANFESDTGSQIEQARKLCETTYKGSIGFVQASFEDLLQALRIPHLPKNLEDAVEDFQAYLDEENLLPTWKDRLDVVNCSGIPEDILEGGVYMCPAVAGPYNHARCRFFGMYRQKRVEHVAVIEAVVDLHGPDDAALRWNNVGGAPAQFVARARESHAARRAGRYPTRVFLLGELCPTNFTKDTPGGMQSSKQYFRIRSLPHDDARQLASALRDKAWSALRESVDG